MAAGQSAAGQQPLPWCSLTVPIHGHWQIDARTFTPTNCRLRNISLEDAGRCLAHRRLVFMGDSVIRNVGLALASYLSGYWPTDDQFRYNRLHPSKLDQQVLSSNGLRDRKHNWTIRVVHRSYHTDWPDLVGVMRNEAP